MNPFDALSLCYAALDKTKNKKVIQDGVSWYRELKKSKDMYQVLHGYANILYKRQSYDESARMYKKVIELNPSFLPAYEALLWIYEFYRINKSLSTEYCDKILKMDPKNKYAL